MLGDAFHILNTVRSPYIIKKAFTCALNDRVSDYYYDSFEIDYVRSNEDKILIELQEELITPETYAPRPAYAYFPPKNLLCYRRMIYIPFKDLVVRYAIAIVLSDLLDKDLSPLCFANRREQGDRADRHLLKDFASHSWPSFCQWQKDLASDSKYNTLLRTDISAFYDSVSHDDLVRTIANQLKISHDAPIMQLLKKLLKMPVVARSHLDGNSSEIPTLHQGLAIGNSTEGIFANLYLRAVDETMSEISDIEFGRYNDDMRIFASGREEARQATLVLQEGLLAKGLNLNASKTKLKEEAAGIAELRSKAYEIYDYGSFDNDIKGQGVAQEPLPVEDKPFDEFERSFETDEKISEEKDARDFCHFLGKLLPLSERQPAHIETLKEILTRWHGSSKHASWRLVESFYNSECPDSTQRRAIEVLVECLRNENTTTYAKYRLLHYLVRSYITEENIVFRHIDSLSVEVRTEIKELLPTYLKEPAFELNIIALYSMKILGFTQQELEASVQKYVSKPVSSPIRNALLLSEDCRPSIASISIKSDTYDEEIDDIY